MWSELALRLAQAVGWGSARASIPPVASSHLGSKCADSECEHMCHQLGVCSCRPPRAGRWCNTVCSPKAAAPCGRPSRAFSTSGPEDVSACEPIHLLAWGRGGHVDTTSIEWPIQSQMQVNLAGEKKTVSQTRQLNWVVVWLDGPTVPGKQFPLAGRRGQAPGPSRRNWRWGPPTATDRSHDDRDGGEGGLRNKQDRGQRKAEGP